MAKITRALQKIFGASLSASGNIAEFGSLAAGAPAYSLDPAAIQTSRYLTAWNNALINAPGGLASPALQDMNALFYLVTRQLAYLYQTGVPEWDATTEYHIGSWAQDGNGIPYISKTNTNVGNALTDTNHWQTYASVILGAQNGVSKAWVTFDGRGSIGAQTIYSSFNVSSVTKTATGIYVINFSPSLPNANYAWTGSCGTPNGVTPVAGDNNMLVGGVPGYVPTKTVSQLTVYSWQASPQALEDSSSISVVVFSTTP